MAEQMPTDIDALRQLSDQELVGQTLRADSNYSDPAAVLSDLIEDRSDMKDEPASERSEAYVAYLREVTRRAVGHLSLTKEELFGE